MTDNNKKFNGFKKIIIFLICVVFLWNVSSIYANTEEANMEEVSNFLEDDIQEFIEENQIITDVQEIEGLVVKEIEKNPSKFGLFWRGVREKIEIALTFDPIKKAEKRLVFAEERIRLAEYITENAESDKAQELAIKMSNKAQEFISKIEENKDKILDKVSEKYEEEKGKIFENVLKHKVNREAVLDKIENNLPVKELEKFNLIRENNKVEDEKLKIILKSEKLSELVKNKIQMQYNNLSNRLEYQKEFIEENKELIEKVKEGNENAKVELAEIKKESVEELKETIETIVVEKNIEKEKILEEIKENKQKVYGSVKQLMSEKQNLINKIEEGSEEVKFQLRNAERKMIKEKRVIIKEERQIRENNNIVEVKEKAKEDIPLHPLVEKNRKLLEKLGVNVNTLPRRITPELEKCFREKIGEKRFKEIQTNTSGSSLAPNIFDFIKARKCVNQ